MQTHADLFAGIGGFGLAFERAGVKTVAAVESDKYCQKVLAKHFPDAALFGDITKVSGDDLRAVGFVPEHGIVTGGVPCQDWSVAGKRAGIGGDRSGLFREYLRLLDELRREWFVFENVPGILSCNAGRDFGAILRSLEKLGYCIAVRCLDAQHFGVPQRRRRIFLVGHRGADWRTPAQVLFEPEGGAGDFAAGSQTQTSIAGTVDGGADGVSRSMIYGPERAATLTAGTASTPGVNPPGRRQEDDENLLVTHTHTHCEHDSGRRGSRLSGRRRGGSRGASDCVAALTANGVGTCGADDNQAQAGHFIVDRTGGVGMFR
jgi:DNA (cytosine-5)-methyltransferase 1